MSGQGSEREPIDNSKICLIGFSLFVLLGISFSFFWFGSILYGLMLLGLPAMCIVISTYCYMNNDDEEESFRVPTYIGTHAGASEDDHNLTRLADRPPSYRMTWRRSFIKRFRGSSPASPSGVDPEAATEENHALTALQKDSKPEGGETVVNISNTTIIVTNEDGDVKELKDDDDAVTQSFNKLKLDLQDSLPNYEEAVIIMKSTENLSTA